MLLLRNLIDRRNVGSGTEVKHQVNEVEDFLELVIKCHLVAAAFHHFGMVNVSDTPHSNALPTDLAQKPISIRKKLLMAEMSKVINNYVISHEYASSPEVSSQPAQEEITANPHAERILDEHQYFSLPKPKSCRRLPESIKKFTAHSHASQAVKKVAPDGVYNYASAVLNDGLLLLEFKDAIREGDGRRIIRVWKVLMPYFHYARHKNYKHEAFLLMSYVNACVSPLIATQMVWSRVVNVRGGSSHNIPLDLHMEHLNHVLKDYVVNLGANKGEKTIIQCGKSLAGIMGLCQEFDVENNLAPQSVEHTKASYAKDLSVWIMFLGDF